MRLTTPGGWRGAVAGTCLLALTGCVGGGGDTVQISGAGASFPFPIYSKWFSDYGTLHPDVQVNYQSVGSGAGIRQMQNRTVFFGATDGPMTDEQLANAPGAILHLPTVLGAVVPVYNLPEAGAPLRFTGPLLADIFLGTVTRWDDPAIAAVNPDATLPDLDITVAHRSDGSGTTYIFVDYLSKVSPAWSEQVGVATSVNWPVGLGGARNDGVAALVKQTPGAIGYVELIYAEQNDIEFGAVENAAGEFVTASLEATTAAAAGAAANMPDDFRVSITNAPGAGAYPIASFTWMLFYQDAGDPVRAQAMVDFMEWALTEGQQSAAELGYAPLPASVVALEREALATIVVE